MCNNRVTRIRVINGTERGGRVVEGVNGKVTFAAPIDPLRRERTPHFQGWQFSGGALGVKHRPTDGELSHVYHATDPVCTGRFKVLF